MMKQLKTEVPIIYIGAKPGERLSEQGYPDNETMPTALAGMGKLKENPFCKEETHRIIGHLAELTRKKKDQELIDLMKSLKNSKN